MTWQLLCGSALEVLATLPANAVQCVVTSPPYWGHRDYRHPGQLGMEAHADAYLAALVATFDSVRRVLTSTGTLWLNFGDAYAGSRTSYNVSRSGLDGRPNLCEGRRTRRGMRTGLRSKNLIGLPWRVALALQAAGWYLRADIIWHKPNCLPESASDRPTRAHEYVFLLTPSARYQYDADAIREPMSAEMWEQVTRSAYEGHARKDYASAGAQNASDVKRRILARHKRIGPKTAAARSATRARGASGGEANPPDLQSLWERGANARSVWTIPPEPSSLPHFAMMPKALARKCILAGCPPGLTVLDPFAGAGTTGIVALEEGRNFVGIELHPETCALARERLRDTMPLLATEQTA